MNILFKPVSQLLKLKPITFQAMERLGIYNAKDLLLHKPHHYISRIINPNLSSLKHDDYIVSEVIVQDIERPKKKGAPMKIYAGNETGNILLIFFGKPHPFILNQLKIGTRRTIEGKVELNDFYCQISHPELILDRRQLLNIIPVYPLTHGINNKQLYSCILKILEEIKNNYTANSSLTPASKNFFNQFFEAIQEIHAPKSLNDIEKHTKTLARFELLSNQISLLKLRKQISSPRSNFYPKAIMLQNQALQTLGFELTLGQERVIKEIELDQTSQFGMTRMLQGDVGAGKTLVALMTILNVMAQKVQSALMAPTDLLATQHYAFFTKVLGNESVVLLTGKTKLSERKKILAQIESGEILVLIGTHALFQNNVNFGNLGYIVIDEQHRFGVEQRLELLAKANNPDLLLMTATPIPRSLSLTLFGDMSISKLTSKPEGRPEIITIASPKTKTDEIIASLDRKLELGEKVYWICPLIEQNEEKAIDDLTDIISRFNSINALYPQKVALLHGKMPADTKDEIMIKFKKGDISILVATTVIEVGIDVPDTTLIVIENAERFGLAQLHQLRGRVGRSALASHCVLLYSHLGGMIKQRIEIMRTSNDGFYIAEEDLKLRGGGEILGIKQSGQEKFRFADLSKDIELLIECKKEAELITYNDDVDLLVKIFNNNLFDRSLGS